MDCRMKGSNFIGRAKSSVNGYKRALQDWVANQSKLQKSLKHYCLPTPPMQAIEATNIILTPLDHDPVSIVSVYIPPSSDDNLFTIDLEYFLQTSSHCVVFGDFNATHSAWNCNVNSNRGKHLFNFANILNLHIAFS
ncbi:putative RNA-directed DNA polymerase from transposon X-element [Trichonephila clavipes]|nr:putative RNA-directed DNA polymerase from transposon X-element [Trichonephila clavipes]